MEVYEYQVIFSQTFPDATPTAMLDEAEKLYRLTPEEERKPTPTYKEMLRRFKEDYTYKLRPDAEEKGNQFISYAIEICREFEIDTEIIRKEHEIAVDMDIYYSWYGGPVKRALETLLVLSDNISLTSNREKPDCVCVSFAYHTHDKFYRGKKVEQ